jgi:hypothetical protein
MRIAVRLSSVAVASLSLLLGCGGGTEPLARCSGPVTVTVSGGATPTIDWAPACGAEELRVNEVASPTSGFGDGPRWIIDADSRLIEPPVRYGQTSRGAVVTMAPEPLEPGRAHRALVGRLSFVWGFAQFVP